MTDHERALAGGGATWAALMVAYGGALVVRGRDDVPRALVYNAPIAFLFLVVAVYGALRTYRLGLRAALRANLAVGVVWIAGFAVLYLRLVSKSLEVSGHLAWLPLLTTQAWILDFPKWMVGLGIGALVSAAYLKFVVFRGPSGGPGLVVGLVLAAAVWAASRPRATPCR